MTVSGRSERKVDAYCSQRSYLDHVLPVWNALPPRLRGQLYVEGGAVYPTPTVRHVRGRPHPRSGSPVIVASAQDHRHVRNRGTIYLEHGAGQTYVDDRDASYAGGRNRDGVRLFVCPSERVARLNRLAYPSADAVVVGCPKLDPWHAGERPSGDREGVIAVSFHFNGTLCPETMSAFPHYRDVVAELARTYDVVAHWHPRWGDRLRGYWLDRGVSCLVDFADVLDRADVYVVDNSSTAYEFASTERPVISLNAPWYRRDVEHGLRFWSHVPGRQVNAPDELDAALTEALLEPWSHSELREAATREVYAFTDGKAAYRAARAVEDTI